MNKKEIFKRYLAGSPAGILAFAILLVASHYGGIEYVEKLTADIFRRELATPLDSRIELVYLDEDSIRTAERDFDLPWPWPREMYASALEFCKNAGAKAVVFDLPFNTPSLRGPKDDLKFAKAVKGFGAVFAGFQTYAAPLRKSLENFNALPRYYDLPTIYNITRGTFDIRQGVEYPKLPLWGSFAGLGDAGFLQDPDGLYRRQRLMVELGGRIYPSLPLAVVWNLKGKPPLSLEDGCLKMGDSQMPLDKGPTFNLLFRKVPENTDARPRIRLFDVVRSQDAVKEGQKPLVNRGRLRGKVVLIGSTAPELVSLKPGPLNKQSPGFEINAIALDNLWNGQSLRVISLNWPSWIAIFLICLLVSILSFRLPAAVIVLVPGLPAALIWLAIKAYVARQILVPIATPFLAIWLSAGLSAGAHFFLERRRRASIRTAFGQFLSPAVLKKLMAEEKAMKLGGEKVALSVFFSDLQGFTTFSEKLDPQVLVEILNYYLTEMGEVIVGQCQGYLDKYEGDAIMAFWNAPTPDPGHALSACRAAWLCQKRLESIQPTLAKMGFDNGGKGLVMRVGISTGDAVAGLMGGKRKLSYTAVGDSVNLASRLEGVNKAYGSGIIISEDTFLAAGEAISARELDLIRVQGKSEPNKVYELTGLAGQGGEPADAAFLAAWQEALQRFRGRDFMGARAAFENCLNLKPGDGPSQVYQDRCREYQSRPPGPEWDGIYVMKTK